MSVECRLTCRAAIAFSFFFRFRYNPAAMFEQPVTRQNLSLDVLRSRALPLLLLLPLLFIAACSLPHLGSSCRPHPLEGRVSSDRYCILVRPRFSWESNGQRGYL